jgi:hypothetical protein
MSDDPTGSEASARAEIEDLLTQLSDADTQLTAPPTDLWNRIERATTGEAVDSVDRIGAQASEADLPDGVISLDQRRRPKALAFLAAAAAIVAVVGFAVSVTGTDPAAQQLAEANLVYDPVAFDPLGVDAAATALLIDEDGLLTVQIDDASLPTAGDADLEVWLIEPDSDGNPADLVSLGIYNPDDPSALTVPANYDPDIYYVVDISIEPHDGDPTHSGRSILRGALTSI